MKYNLKIDRKRFILLFLTLVGAKAALDFIVTRHFGASFAAHAYFTPWLNLPGSHWALQSELPQYESVLVFRFILNSLAHLATLILAILRAQSIGMPLGVALFSLVPFVNIAYFIAFAAVPEKKSIPAPVTAERSRKISTITKTVLLTAALGVLAVLLEVFGFKNYGITLFVAAPFFLGMISGYFTNSRELRSTKESLSDAMLAVTTVGVLLLCLALEGIICLAMAAPIAYGAAAIGALLGRVLTQRTTRKSAHVIASMSLLMPTSGALEAQIDAQPPLRTVTTSIEIDAPPSTVWRYIVDVPEIPEPEQWEFRAGISYPTSAHAESHAVGAIRTCTFNTGDVLERITELEPEKKLTFIILSQPHLMKELSPYPEVHAPHLDGGVRSEKGEFRLTALPGGRTRVEGQSWYRSEFAPDLYWGVYSDRVVKLIHLRVLEHIRALSERKP
jgi:hypothetical protein